jgi:hypothetical protein
MKLKISLKNKRFFVKIQLAALFSPSVSPKTISGQKKGRETQKAP